MKRLVAIVSLMALATPAYASPVLTGWHTVYSEDFSAQKQPSTSATYDGSDWYAYPYKQCCMSVAKTDPVNQALLFPDWPPAPGNPWQLTVPFSFTPDGIRLTLSQQSSPVAGNSCSTPTLCWIGAQLSSVATDGKGRAWKPPLYIEVTGRVNQSYNWPSIVAYNLPGSPAFEADIMEWSCATSTNPCTPYADSGSIHDWARYPKGPAQSSNSILPSIFDSQWHTYAVKVTPDSPSGWGMVEFYQDGQLFHSLKTPADALQPWPIVITEGVGPGWSSVNTPNPSTFDVGRVVVMQPVGQ